MKKSATDAAPEARPPRRKRWIIATGVVVVIALLAAPFWGPRALGKLAFFHVRRIEVLGARFTPASEVLDRLHVDTTRSVWDPLGPLVERLQSYPQVERVAVSRKLPGTLVVEITERRPVAFVTAPEGLVAVDERGRHLPLDPSRTTVDVPIVNATPRDTAVYHLLGAMQREAPRLFAQVSTISRVGADELILRIADIPVRAMTSVSLARLSDIEPIERDLARRQLRPAELDLRYRDQVIARVP
ncbi:MAG: ftsQ [Gemmatimonadetes bacterium]|nr:ftsQ [Gemmatimonadota bacterium]